MASIADHMDKGTGRMDRELCGTQEGYAGLRKHGKEKLLFSEEWCGRVGGRLFNLEQSLAWRGSGHGQQALCSGSSLLEARGRSVSVSSLIWATSCSFSLFL